MKWVYADGGRSEYYTNTRAYDADFAIALCNATGKDYLFIKKMIEALKNKFVNIPRDKIFALYLEKVLGWKKIKGYWGKDGKYRLHFTDEEMPKKGAYIVKLSRHYTYYKDGVIYDTQDCSTKTYYDLKKRPTTNKARQVFKMWKDPNYD